MLHRCFNLLTVIAKGILFMLLFSFHGDETVFDDFLIQFSLIQEIILSVSSVLDMMPGTVDEIQF